MYKGFRVIALTVLIVIMSGCGYLAGVFCNQSTAPKFLEAESELTDPAEAFREQRHQERQIQITQLNEMIHTTDVNQEIQELAQKKLLELMNCTEKEITLEGILSIRGFDDPLVIVHADAAHVFIRDELVTEQQASIILDCVTDEMEISAGNVKIIPIK